MIFGPDAGSIFLSTFLIGVPATTFCIKTLLEIQKDGSLFVYGVLGLEIFLTLLVCYPSFIVEVVDGVKQAKFGTWNQPCKPNWTFNLYNFFIYFYICGLIGSNRQNQTVKLSNW